MKRAGFFLRGEIKLRLFCKKNDAGILEDVMKYMKTLVIRNISLNFVLKN